jgi:hypothetical protein
MMVVAYFLIVADGLPAKKSSLQTIHDVASTFTAAWPTALANPLPERTANIAFVGYNRYPLSGNCRLAELDRVLLGEQEILFVMMNENVEVKGVIPFQSREDYYARLPKLPRQFGDRNANKVENGRLLAAALSDIMTNFFEAVNWNSAAHRIFVNYARTAQVPTMFRLYCAVLASADFLIRFDVFWWNQGYPINSTPCRPLHIPPDNFYEHAWQIIQCLGPESAFIEFVIDGEQRRHWLDIFTEECKSIHGREAAFGWTYARRIIGALTFDETREKIIPSQQILDDIIGVHQPGPVDGYPYSCGFGILMDVYTFSLYFQGENNLVDLPV